MIHIQANRDGVESYPIYSENTFDDKGMARIDRPLGNLCDSQLRGKKILVPNDEKGRKKRCQFLSSLSACVKQKSLSYDLHQPVNQYLTYLFSAIFTGGKTADVAISFCQEEIFNKLGSPSLLLIDQDSTLSSAALKQ